VAWRWKARAISPGGMPQPSSTTRMSRSPPPRTSTRTWRAPASSAFSTSSFTTDAGRSTTSPAAMRSAAGGGRTRIGRRGAGSATSGAAEPGGAGGESSLIASGASPARLPAALLQGRQEIEGLERRQVAQVERQQLSEHDLRGALLGRPRRRRCRSTLWLRRERNQLARSRLANAGRGTIRQRRHERLVGSDGGG